MWLTPSSTARPQNTKRSLTIRRRPEDPGARELHGAEADATDGATGERKGLVRRRGHERRLFGSSISPISRRSSWQARRSAADRVLVQREADAGADRCHDPEAQNDLRLRPGHHLEVVMDRGHQQDPAPEELEAQNLDGN